MLELGVALKAYQVHGSVMKAARALGVSKSTLQRWYTRDRNAGAAPAATLPPPRTTAPRPGPAPSAPTPVGRSVAEFQRLHNPDIVIPEKIRAALAGVGADKWVYETELARLAGMASERVRAYRHLFPDHVVAVKLNGPFVWAGSPEAAQQLRSAL